MKLKENITFSEAVSFLFTTAQVLDPVDRNRLYESVQDARIRDDAKAIVQGVIDFLEVNK